MKGKVGESRVRAKNTESAISKVLRFKKWKNYCVIDSIAVKKSTSKKLGSYLVFLKERERKKR